MKTTHLYYLLLLIFFSFNVSGQSVEDTISQDYEPDSLALLDYQYTTADDLGMIEDKSPLLPTPEKLLVVRYQSSASVFIEFGLDKPSQFSLIDRESTREPSYYSTSENVIEGLPIDRVYDLVVFSEGKEQVVGLISTFAQAEKTSFIDMYPSMYNDASEWATQSADRKLGLFDFVKTSEWHDLEKTWFLQQYYGYGYPLPDEFKGKIPSRDDFDESGTAVQKTDCMCRPLRLSFDQSIRPLAGGIPTQQKDGVYQNTWATPPSESFSKAGKRWVAWGIKGPAKYMQAWQETPRCTRGRTFENTMSSDETQLEGAGTNFTNTTGGKQSIVRMIWACVGFGELIPENCMCERAPRIRVCYTYSGEAMANAETLGGGWCRGGRGVAAYAEDHSAIFFNPDANNLDNVEPIDVGILRAGVGCSYSVDWSKFLASLAKTGFYATKALVKAKTVIGVGVSIYYGIKLGEELSNLAKGPVENFSGNCGTRRAQGPAIMDGCFTRQLDQNKEAVVVLQSTGTVHVEGKGRHKGTARILSSFGLTVTMQPSDPDQIGPICCRTGNGVYSLAHTPGNPFSSLGELQTWARNQFFIDGLDQVDNIDNMNGEWGYRDGGGINEECQLQIANVTPLKPYIASHVDHATVVVADQVIQIENRTENHYELRIIDINGSPLAQESVAPMINLSYDLAGWDIPQGVYIYQLSDGRHIQTGKLFKR